MTDDTTNIESGTFALDTDARTLRGILLPWGEKSRPSASNTDPIYFERGSVAIPRDVSVVTLNREHDRFDPVGRATVLEDRDEGIYAEFAVADTDEGDAYLADPSKLRKLSAEVTGIVRDAKQRARGVAARLTGGALVTEGAFASAALFAIGDEATANPEPAPVVFTPDENGDIAVTATEAPETVTVTAADTVTVFEPKPEDTTEGNNAMADAAAPETLTASAATPEAIGLNGLFALLHKAQKGDAEAVQTLRTSGSDALFALNDVAYDSVGGLNTVQLPQFVGEVWQARRVGRQVVPAFDSAPLTDTTLKAWKWGTRPEVDVWAGNKAAVPTSTPSVSQVDGVVQRFAGGNDIAREFYDFGKTEVINSLLSAYADSYASKSDAWLLAQAVAAVTPVDVSVPAGVPDGLGKIVQGALAIVGAGGAPSVAFVAPDVFSNIVFTRKDDTLEYLNAMVGTDLTEGGVQNFRIVPRADMLAGEVLVADRNAVTAYELPGSPIRVNALDMVKGGIDEAVFGYIGAIINDPAGLALITNVTP